MKKSNCLAMILAGGKGSRLGVLTKDQAKPGLLFGGKYRIIDFPLSNCRNSGIDTVGILTQYQPLELNWYIGNGSSWNLDSTKGGTYVLPPYQSDGGSNWYRGTADAIYQNLNFVEMVGDDYVLILSGDHIYSMDYDKMLNFHKKHHAKVTIGTIRVPWDEASRFGIMVANENMRITKFQEKPAKPESNLASMGIYIFDRDVLESYLKADAKDEKLEHDFGKNVIPAMLADQVPLYAYPFEGYWKDVGTIDSLWEANLDLLNPKVDLDLSDPSWKIYSRTPTAPPHYVSPDATVQNSMVTEGCEISGDVDFSVIFADVTIEKGAVIRDSIIMPGTVIKSGAVVQYAIVAENAVIEENAVVGERPEAMDDLDKWGVAVIGKGVTVKKGTKIEPKAMYDGEKEDGRK